MRPTVDFGKAWTKAWVRTPARLTAVLVLAACGGEGSPTQPDGGEGNGGGGGGRPPSIKAEPSFSTDIQEIFDRRSCNADGCHGPYRAAGLDLRAGAAFGSLVNKWAQSESGFIRVVPNNAQDSYLVIALEGRRTLGPMPPGGSFPVDSIDLGNIRNWIDQGALLFPRGARP